VAVRRRPTGRRRSLVRMGPLGMTAAHRRARVTNFQNDGGAPDALSSPGSKAKPRAPTRREGQAHIGLSLVLAHHDDGFATRAASRECRTWYGRESNPWTAEGRWSRAPCRCEGAHAERLRRRLDTRRCPQRQAVGESAARLVARRRSAQATSSPARRREHVRPGAACAMAMDAVNCSGVNNAGSGPRGSGLMSGVVVHRTATPQAQQH